MDSQPHEHGGLAEAHPQTHLRIIVSFILNITTIILDIFFLRVSENFTLSIHPVIQLISFVSLAGFSVYLLKLTQNTVYGDEQKLVDTGIYAYTRNPMYLAGLILNFSFILLAMSIIALISFIVIFLLYNNMVNFEETKLEKKLGQEYLEYKKKVKKWIPGIY